MLIQQILQFLALSIIYDALLMTVWVSWIGHGSHQYGL